MARQSSLPAKSRSRSGMRIPGGKSHRAKRQFTAQGNRRTQTDPCNLVRSHHALNLDRAAPCLQVPSRASLLARRISKDGTSHPVGRFSSPWPLQQAASRRDGSKIAQRFNAGLRGERGASPAGTTEIGAWLGRLSSLRDLCGSLGSGPALKRWAILEKSLRD